MDRYMAKRIFWGLLIVAAGVLFLLRQLNFFYFDLGDLISTFWPVIMIMIGIDGVIGDKNKCSSNWWAWFMVGLGGFFLARNLGLVDFSLGELIRYALPVILIGFGISMIFKPRSNRVKKDDNDWHAYSADDDVPPAPPLHPDPTMTSPNFDNDMSSPPPPPTGHSKHSHKQSSGKNERVEWWNYDSDTQTKSGFIGDIHLGQDYWELKPMNISHFIGDTVLDLTKAQIPYGETRLTISSFIGDVKVFLPNDNEVGVHVVSSAFIGDSTILERKEGGIFQNTNTQSPRYQDCDKRVKLVVSTFIGDVRVTKVG